MEAPVSVSAVRQKFQSAPPIPQKPKPAIGLKPNLSEKPRGTTCINKEAFTQRDSPAARSKPSPAPRNLSGIKLDCQEKERKANTLPSTKPPLPERPRPGLQNRLLPPKPQRIGYENIVPCETVLAPVPSSVPEDSTLSAAAENEGDTEDPALDDSWEDEKPSVLEIKHRTPRSFKVKKASPPSRAPRDVDKPRVHSNPECQAEEWLSDSDDYEAVTPKDHLRPPLRQEQRQISGSDSLLTSLRPALPERNPRKPTHGDPFDACVPPPRPPKQTSSERLNRATPPPELPKRGRNPSTPATPLSRNPPAIPSPRSSSPPPVLPPRQRAPKKEKECVKKKGKVGMSTVIKTPPITDPSEQHAGYLPMDEQRAPRDSCYIASNEIESVPMRRPSEVSLPDPFPEISSRKNSEQDDYILLLDEDMSDPSSQIFEDEPLYQIYHQGMVVKEVMEGTGHAEEDDDDIYNDPKTLKIHVDSLRDASQQPEGLIRSNFIDSVSRLGSGRTRKMWSEMPQVIALGVLDTMSAQERRLQEALFEIIASEASYLKSIKILIKEFIQAPRLSGKFDNCVLQLRDKKDLFSNVKAVRDVSTEFMGDLEKLWMNNAILTPGDLCDLMTQYAQGPFDDVYVKYCKNQQFQDRALKRLTENLEFCEVMKTLEQKPVCQGLTMQSFLVLPMQRVTRLPLLVDAVCHRVDENHQDYGKIQSCLLALQKVVKRCNDEAKRMENVEKVANIDSMLSFKDKKIPLVSPSRSLVKEGLVTSHSGVANFLTKFKSRRDALYFFLFNDLMLITRKKSENDYSVQEHEERQFLVASAVSDEELLLNWPAVSRSSSRFYFTLVLLQKDIKYLLSCKSETERQRWIEAIAPPTSNEDESVYGEWDCPQVQAIYQYVSVEPDELSLEESDIINVFKKMPDDWYLGERLRDGERGWFPANHTIEIQSAHLRSKNLKQKYRMLQNAHDELRRTFNRNS